MDEQNACQPHVGSWLADPVQEEKDQEHGCDQRSVQQNLVQFLRRTLDAHAGPEAVPALLVAARATSGPAFEMQNTTRSHASVREGMLPAFPRT
eukprot:2842527-Rhodomonas_salina.1